MKELTQILAFYSFKGGVGRSMAVLNLAYSLAAKGRHVLVLDMDLEAPGLSGFLHRAEEIARFAEFDMVDLVKWASSVIPPIELSDYPPRTDYVAIVPPERVVLGHGHPSESGHLDIIPVQEDRHYYDRLAELDLGKYDQDGLVRTGSVLRSWLKSLRFSIEVPDYYGPNCERTASYDYVLVDSRTGITETGGLCIGPLSDQLVVLTALNDQNVQGTRKFLEEVGVLGNPVAAPKSSGEPGSEPGSKPYLIVPSLVPAGEIKKKQERIKCLEGALGKTVVKLSYHPQLALEESIFTRDYRDEYLAGEYEELLRQIQEMTSDGLDDVLPRLRGQSQTPEQLREDLGQFLRSPRVTSLAFLLHYPLSRSDFSKLSQDTDFILWDRVCRVLAQSEEPLRWDVIQRWANLLSQWSLQPTDQGLASARLENAMSRYAEALKDKNASPLQKAMALFNRGVTYGKHGEQEKAIADYTAVAQMPDAPAEQKSRALVNRGVAYGKQGESEKEIADYTAVVQMPNAPAEQKAAALVNRGMTYGRQGESEKAIADYTAVVQMPDALVEHKAQSLVGRGWMHFVTGHHSEAIQDNRHAITLVPNKCFAHGNLAIALLISGQRAQALESYDRALTLATKEELGEIRKDLHEAIEKRGPMPGAEEVMRRLEARFRSAFGSAIGPASEFTPKTTITSLVSMYEKGAITADHLVAQCIQMIDPDDPGLVLSDLPNSILDRMLVYARRYQPDRTVSNYGNLPTTDQVEAAKNWIEGLQTMREAGKTNAGSS